MPTYVTVIVHSYLCGISTTNIISVRKLFMFVGGGGEGGVLTEGLHY